MSAVHITVTGGDKYKAILEKIARLKITARAGIPAGATTTSGMSIAKYAYWNEIGLPDRNLPARPFMRTTANEHQNEWCETLAGALKGEILKDNAKGAMGLVGEQMKAHIQQTIQKGSFAPNSPKTVANKRRKGKVEPDHPLIDTGQMLASIISEVKG
jgi:hypothetical protein